MDKRLAEVHRLLVWLHIHVHVYYATVHVIFFLLQEFELRKQARAESRRYCNTGALTYQAERMPEQIRLNVCYIRAGV